MDKKEKKSENKKDNDFSANKEEIKKDLQELKDSLSEREKLEKKIVWDKINLMER